MPNALRLTERWALAAGLTRGTVAIALVLLLSACTRHASMLPVSAAGGAAHEPSLATFADGMAVAWYDTRDRRGDLYMRALDGDGAPVGPELRLTAGPNDAYEADAHAVRSPAFGDGVAIGWYEKFPDGRLQPRVGVWTRDGTYRWSKAVAPEGRNTVVRVSGQALFVAWVHDESADAAGVWGAWWALDGDALTAPRRLADAGRTTWNLNAAIDPASTPQAPRAWVVFDARAGTQAEELFAVDVRGDGLDRVTRLTPDDGKASKYPDLAFSDDRAALTWFDERDGNQEVYLAVGPRDGFEGRVGSTATRITTTDGRSIGAYVAWNKDHLGLAWCDDSSGQHEVFVQTFGATGTPDAAARRLTDTAAASLIPAIRAWKSGFALVWNEYEAPLDEREEGHGVGGRSRIVAAHLP